VVVSCILAVVVSCAVLLARSLRPSNGKRYEQLTVEEALEYMNYEGDYCIVDVRPREDYEEGHLEGAVNLPYDRIVAGAAGVLPDRTQMIYVYGSDEKESCAAAQKLCDMDYQSITEIGGYDQWKAYVTSEETEALMATGLEPETEQSIEVGPAEKADDSMTVHILAAEGPEDGAQTEADEAA